ncbi:quinone oxidoreductase [Knufia obscura]|uniref:Quinone oxidoreductase n=2 Tax=Knufia TaxID=430999 RepID=A0AAN8I839_9EURO|nr:quinone oxidoreductase [Knufia obscura]KAK5956884.1 quinone oxidoreductase [Knufia fluminis]
MSNSLPTKTRQWTLSAHPTGLPTYGSPSDTFTLEEKDLPALTHNQILIQTLYLSNDPAQRGWIAPPSQIDPKRLYVPPVQPGEPMRARGLGKVLASKNDEFKEGDTVQCNACWREYAVLDAGDPAQGVRKVKELPGGLSVTHYLGALGSTGLTAWYGLVEVVGCKKGERVVVSGAAGATGSMVVQIAKHIVGASYVVGIAGSDEKCKWVEGLGADKCLNYKSPTFEKDLKDACGDGVDVYFDNVGGEILDHMLANMSLNGRISACGAITGYNGEAALPMKNYFNVISMRLQIKGFIVIDFLHKAVETIGKLVGAVQEGKIKIGSENETVVETKFEDVPGTWLKLFEGGNQGKLVTKL